LLPPEEFSERFLLKSSMKERKQLKKLLFGGKKISEMIFMWNSNVILILKKK
jgi:hypothetical protein